MTDYFALLNEPRRPWIDFHLLKEKFLALAAEVHPDRVHQSAPEVREAANRRYSELNTAYNCLGDHKDRVRHLLELESGAKPAEIKNVPAEIMDTHFAVASLCRETDVFLDASAKATSPILRVQFFSRAGEWTDKLIALRNQIQSEREKLALQLRAMNSAWETTSFDESRQKRLPLADLDVVYRLLGYNTRWLEQIHERLVQLTLINL